MTMNEDIDLCKTCGGLGSYYEDVVGDGGSRMEIPCDCLDLKEELEELKKKIKKTKRII